jgi:hypothetical protein
VQRASIHPLQHVASHAAAPEHPHGCELQVILLLLLLLPLLLYGRGDSGGGCAVALQRGNVLLPTAAGPPTSRARMQQRHAVDETKLGRQVVLDEIPRAAGRKRVSLFLRMSAFPVFVPSLSW